MAASYEASVRGSGGNPEHLPKRHGICSTSFGWPGCAQLKHYSVHNLRVAEGFMARIVHLLSLRVQSWGKKTSL